MAKILRTAASATNVIGSGKDPKRATPSPDKVRREYAGKYVAWAPDGITIIAVARSFTAAERKAAKAGYPMVAVARVPEGRTINYMTLHNSDKFRLTRCSISADCTRKPSLPRYA